jgi:hypothetical protein
LSVPTRTRRSARSSLSLALLMALCVGGGALAADEDGPGTEAAAMEELPDPIIDPDRAEGWAVDGPPRIYLRDTLSDFINGGAALYLGYSFRWVAVWVVRSSGFDLEATIELYRFSEPSDALGVYLNGARGPGEGLPFERSQVRRGLLRAQRGPYFVRVLCRDQGVRADDAARSLGGVLGLALPPWERSCCRGFAMRSPGSRGPSLLRPSMSPLPSRSTGWGSATPRASS